MDKEDKYEISIPDPDHPGEFRSMSDALTKDEALAYVQEHYNADEEGRVCLINRLPEDKKEGDIDDE